MMVEQISIFLENKAGRLAEVTQTLANNGININALALADTSEFGILRLIVDKHEEAKKALKEKGFTVGRTNVVAVEVPHTPGGLNSILQTLGKNNINVEYMYGFYHKGESAVNVIRFDQPEKAAEVLQANGIRIFSSQEICSSK